MYSTLSAIENKQFLGKQICPENIPHKLHDFHYLLLCHALVTSAIITQSSFKCSR